jgi:hypothetical protein
MQQIADWLEKLGLGQYAQRFAENDIDVSVLPHLTDQDLKDMGVPLGPRQKILAAISKNADESVWPMATRRIRMAERRFRRKAEMALSSLPYAASRRLGSSRSTTMRASS